ncbi:hypothetical protein [Azorhizobium sp. AG788]|uniref:hypothetical protein n=1 Tax=Azorhizobium sp. AG788 TaxID=2183897 RepID=UPI0031397433
MKQKPDPRASDPRTPAPFVLGRARFEQISAVEGISTAPETARMFADFDRTGADAQQRRALVLAKFRRTA